MHNTHMLELKISQNLKKLMFERQIRTAELARLIGLKQPTVHRIVEGVIRKPRISSMEPLAKFFDLSIEQLMGFKPLPSEQIKPSVQSTCVKHVAPIIRWDEINPWLNDSFFNAEEHIYLNKLLGPKSFALKMKDLSMSPLFPPKTTLIFDPQLPINDQCYALIYHATENTYLFRRLIHNEEIYFMKAINPKMPNRINKLTNNDRIISAISQAQMNY